eukprot:2801864-Lingulodinium_polyedra.AAC.1
MSARACCQHRRLRHARLRNRIDLSGGLQRASRARAHAGARARCVQSVRAQHAAHVLRSRISKTY